MVLKLGFRRSTSHFLSAATRQQCTNNASDHTSFKTNTPMGAQTDTSTFANVLWCILRTVNHVLPEAHINSLIRIIPQSSLANSFVTPCMQMCPLFNTHTHAHKTLNLQSCTFRKYILKHCLFLDLSLRFSHLVYCHDNH